MSLLFYHHAGVIKATYWHSRYVSKPGRAEGVKSRCATWTMSMENRHASGGKNTKDPYELFSGVMNRDDRAFRRT